MPHQGREIRRVVFVICASTALIVAISLIGFSSANGSAQRDHKTLVKVDQTQQLTVYNSGRAECIREIQSKLDEARWKAVGKLISGSTRDERIAAGTDLLALPNSFDLLTKGGVINGERIDKCAPIVRALPRPTT